MRRVDVQVGGPSLSSWHGMRRTRQRKSTQAPGDLPGDGAELPLVNPGLLPQLSRGEKERRTSNSEGDCLILSDDELGKFDADRVAEVRDGLSGEFRVDPFGRGEGPAPRGMGLRHMVFAVVIVALAVVVGVTIGLVF